MCLEVRSAAKNVDTNCGPLSARIVFRTPNGKTLCPSITVAASGTATLGTGSALVCFLYRSVIITTDRFRLLVLVEGPRMSVAISSSDPLG